MATLTLADKKKAFYREHLGYTEVQVASKSLTDLENEFFNNPQVATDPELAAHESDTSNIHGIVDTTQLVTLNTAQTITGLKTVQPSGTSAIGLVVKQITGGGGNLQEFQTAAGAIASYVNAGGNPSFSYDTLQSGVGGANVKVEPRTNSGLAALIVRATSGFTSNLQEWQNSAAAILARISSGGNLFVQRLEGANGSAGPGLVMEGASARLDPGTGAASVVVYIQGAAAQTGNLTEWRDSASAVLSRIGSNGRLGIGAAAAGDAYIQATGTSTTLIRSTTTNAGASASTAYSKSTREWQLGIGPGLGDDRLAIFDITSNAVRFTVKDITGQITAGHGNAPAGMLDVRPSSSGVIGIVVRGAASQSSNLEEWQNSANSVLASVNSAGEVANAGWVVGTVPSWKVQLNNISGQAGFQIVGSTSNFTIQGSQTLTIDSFLKWVSGKEQTTVGAAGGASAPPATPTKYLQVKDSAGTTFVIAAYAAA